MKLDGALIKDLQIFLAVVESNGISNAQARLNRDASVISRSVSSLEKRLGLRLCERGRQGFSLTPDGRTVYEETLRLMSACRGFEQRVGGLKDGCGGHLNIGIIDNIISDPACPLHLVLNSLQQDDGISLSLKVCDPPDLETELLDRRLDLVIGIFERHHAMVEYQPLYSEPDFLFCAADSALGQAVKKNAPESELYALLEKEKFCTRHFLNKADIDCLGFRPQGDISYTSNLEAMTFLVLSGYCCGFIPRQYVLPFIEQGRLTAVLPESLYRKSVLEAGWRRGEEQHLPVLRRMLQLLDSAGEPA